MSSAFIREGEYQPLGDVAPNPDALRFYLRKENGGIPVREIKSYYSAKHQREIYEMSDGLTYALNDENRWYVIWEI
ncbi:MAG: hypothetical protein V4721_06965 [Bacteroidota bacterium]